LQGNEKEKMMTDTSGRKCLELFGNYARAGSWAKTFSALLIGTGDWYSRRCKLTWKVKGTKYNRIYFQLAPSTLPTDGTESGLWPTPNCVQRDRTEIAIKHREEGIPLYTRRDKAGTARQFSIVDYAVYKGLLPTPMAQDGKNSTLPASQQKRNSIVGMLCTPTAQASRGNTSAKRGKGNLTDQIAEMELTTSTTSQLNPPFVLEMMGFPPDWTELPFLSGETKV
jgi:hypothetical protein